MLFRSASSTSDDRKVTSHTSNDRETPQSTKRRGTSLAAAHERKPARQATHNRQRAQRRNRKRQAARNLPAHEREAAHQAVNNLQAAHRPRRHHRGSFSTKKPTDNRKPGHSTGRQRDKDAGNRDARDEEAGQQIQDPGAGIEARAGQGWLACQHAAQDGREGGEAREDVEQGRERESARGGDVLAHEAGCGRGG